MPNLTTLANTTPSHPAFSEENSRPFKHLFRTWKGSDNQSQDYQRGRNRWLSDHERHHPVCLLFLLPLFLLLGLWSWLFSLYGGFLPSLSHKLVEPSSGITSFGTKAWAHVAACFLWTSYHTLLDSCHTLELCVTNGPEQPSLFLEQFLFFAPELSNLLLPVPYNLDRKKQVNNHKQAHF